jgi:acyl transferase domain-containing protein
MADRLLDLVRTQAAAVLGCPVDEIEPDLGFFELGLDSASAGELGQRLAAALGADLPTTLLFDHPNPASLAAHLANVPTSPPPPVRGPVGLAEPVAIVGMACRVPGAADTAAFWELLRDGTDATGEIPASRWDVDAFYDPDRRTPGKTYTRRGAFLGDVDGFDAGFFGVSPREAAEMDPQQRLFLEVGWEALENAGMAADRLAGTSTGVFAAVTGADYTQSMFQRYQPSQLDAYSLTGLASTFTAGRLSYWLGLHGPSMSVDTACSSSLVAVHLACQSLRAGDCTAALAGGVNLLLAPEMFIVLSKAGMMAPDGRCKTFDSAADGYARGEGCGVVVLKLLSDALDAGDRVLAVIRGSAVNQDGRSSGITVPNGTAQRAVIHRALQVAGVTGPQIGYVEAHGTGTALGDPIEVNALGAVLGADRPAGDPLMIGSVKTNIGHLEPAAGVAGLIKTVLVLRNEEVPPLLHLNEVNPRIPLADLPIVLPTERTPWPRGATPRLAGVSSFGASGTNAHLILEEAPLVEPTPVTVERPRHLVTLSARGDEPLSALAERYRDHLVTTADPLADIAFTANHGRAHFAHRVAVVADTREELATRLSTRDVHSGAATTGARPSVAFLFTGQGSQYAGMGRGLYETQPSFRRDLDHCDEVLRRHLDRPLLSLLYGEFDTLIDRTRYTQPALFALQYALARLWRSWGVEPDAVLGHSVGEYAAACVAGVLSLEDGLALIAERARLMDRLPAGGGMVALLTDEERVVAALAPYAGELAVAAVNGPENVVVSGARQALDALVASLAADGVRAKPLTVSHAFHSPLIEPMLDEFERYAGGFSFGRAELPLVSNLSGRAVTDVDARYLRAHVREPVQFLAGMRELAALGCDTFVEIGPAPVLCGMGRQALTALPDGTGRWLPSLRSGHDDWQTVLDSLAELYVAGADIDWAGYDRDYPRRRVDLPTYPFQRRRHWLKDTAPRPAAGEATSVLGHRVPSPLAAAQFQAVLSVEAHPGLGDCVFEGTAVVNAGFYVEAAVAAARELHGLDPVEVTNLVLPRAFVMPADGRVRTQLVAEAATDERTAFTYHSQVSTEDNDWAMHASGGFTAAGPAPEPAPDELAAVAARCEKTLSGEDFYTGMARKGLTFGPTARWHEHIALGDGEALSWLRAPRADESGYRLHPGIVDAALQLLAVCPAREQEPTSVYMLVELESSVLYGYAGGPLVCHAALRAEPEPAGPMTADLRLWTENGALVAEFRGVHMRQTSRETLMRAVGAAPRATRPVAASRNGAGELVHAALRQDNDAEALRLLRTLLVASTAAVLGGAEAEINEHEPLQNLGLDSLLAVELKDAVATDLGITLPAAMFMDNPSVAGLTAAVAPLLAGRRVEAPTMTERVGPGGMHVVDVGSGEPIVFVHGGAVGGVEAWQTQLALASRWRLVIPSRLNYDRSAATAREDFDVDGPLIAELLAELPGGAHVVAQSYGTVGAMLAAIQCPDAVRSLTLIESGASSVARGRPVVDEFERAMLALLASPPADPEELFRAVFAIIEPDVRHSSPLAPSLATFARRIHTGVRWPLEADVRLEPLAAKGIPTLVVSGGHRPVFEEISDALAAQLNGERLVVHGGHATQNVGTPFNDALEAFLNRVG